MKNKFVEYFEGKAEKENPPYSLYDSITTVSTLECVDCGEEETSDEDSGYAMDTFYANGWRMKDREKPICKKCRRKLSKKTNGK
jgi:hypothetical protein